jgi:Putative zinc-finger
MVVNCEQVWGEVSNYLEGDVDPALRLVLDEHLRTCARCKSVLEGTGNVIALYGDERMLEVPAGFSRRLEKRLVQNGRARRTGWSTWSAWLVPVAALALIAGGLQLANSLTLQHPLKSEHAQPGHDIPPDMPVLVTADTRTFHVAGCTFIHSKSTLRTLTAKEAIQDGYVPCARCLRRYLDVAALSFPAAPEAADEQAAEERELRQAGH